MNRSGCIFLILCLISTGCIPVKVRVGKHIDGVVVEKATGAPISGASLMYAGRPLTEVITGPTGAFTVEPLVFKRWICPFLPFDYFDESRNPLIVHADGYSNRTIYPRFIPEAEVKKIELRRQN